MSSVSTYIHHQIVVIVTTSGDVNRHSSCFKMATERVDERRSSFCHSFLLAKKIPPVEIHRELVMVYGAKSIFTLQSKRSSRQCSLQGK
jgi:hypothetical protein